MRLNCLPQAIHITEQDYARLFVTDENWYWYKCQLLMFSDLFSCTLKVKQQSSCLVMMDTTFQCLRLV